MAGFKRALAIILESQITSFDRMLATAAVWASFVTVMLNLKEISSVFTSNVVGEWGLYAGIAGLFTGVVTATKYIWNGRDDEIVEDDDADGEAFDGIPVDEYEIRFPVGIYEHDERELESALYRTLTRVIELDFWPSAGMELRLMFGELPLFCRVKRVRWEESCDKRIVFLRPRHLHRASFAASLEKMSDQGWVWMDEIK